MKKLISFFILALCIVGSAAAQENNSQKKITIGGEVALVQPISSSYEFSGYSPITLWGGVNLNKHLFLGGELALNSFYSTTIVPVSVKFKWRMLGSRLSPYAACNLGYNIFVSNSDDEWVYSGSDDYNPGVYDGLFVKTELGLDLKLTSTSSIHIGASANNQSVRIVTGNDLTSTERHIALLLAYKVGYSYSF